MNAYQRRKESRRLHMELPLGKPVRLAPLMGRRVYGYGSLSRDITLYPRDMAQIEYATVSRHVRCGHGGCVDLMLFSRDGDQQCISTSARGIRLLNPADRASRPWWVETRRAHKARAKAGAA